MKRLLFPAAMAFSVVMGSCTENAANTGTPPTTTLASDNKARSYGEKFSAEGAIASTDLVSLLTNQDSAQATVTSNVLEVCHAKGCWMSVAVEGQEPMRVTFRNYGFFMPEDIVGKEVVFKGVALRDTVSVEDQSHFAEDAGKSKAEIATITKPKPSITFIATGVQVKE